VGVTLDHPSFGVAQAAEATAETRDHLERGRWLGSLRLEDLETIWVIAFTAWVENLRDSEVVQITDDVGAELRLRGFDIPIRRALAAYRKLPSPELAPETWENVSRAIDAIMRKRGRRN
jgi:hypothetical protein